MTQTSLPTPVTRPPARWQRDSDALRRDLELRVDGEVRFDAGTRAAYSTDASNFRQVPIGVVVPRSVEAGAEAIAVCRGRVGAFAAVAAVSAAAVAALVRAVRR